MSSLWTRPQLLVTTPIRAWIAGGIAGALAMLVSAPLVSKPQSLVPLALPLPAPAPQVVVMPSAPVIVRAPDITFTPPTAPAAEPVAPPPHAVARATTPHLHPACLVPIIAPDGEMPMSPDCNWDEGFPAISADGSTIAVLDTGNDGERGFPNETVHFYDVARGELVTSSKILDVTEYDPEHSDRAQKLAIKRAADVQRMLDDGAYRSLQKLPVVQESSEDSDVAFAEQTSLFALRSDEAMQLIDPAGKAPVAIWQGTIGVAKSHSIKADDECPGWNLAITQYAIDPASHTLVASLLYQSGGCICPDYTYTKLVHLPANVKL